MSLVWSGLLRGLAWLPLVFLEWLVRRRLQRGGVVRLKFDRRLMRDEGPESIVHLAADLHGMAEDPNVLAVWIELHQLPPGWSSVQEIREALAAIRSNGKLVVVCLQNLTNGGLLLASVADRVWMVPSGRGTGNHPPIPTSDPAALASTRGAPAQGLRFSAHGDIPAASHLFAR